VYQESVGQEDSDLENGQAVNASSSPALASYDASPVEEKDASALGFAVAAKKEDVTAQTTSDVFWTVSTDPEFEPRPAKQKEKGRKHRRQPQRRRKRKLLRAVRLNNHKVCPFLLFPLLAFVRLVLSQSYHCSPL